MKIILIKMVSVFLFISFISCEVKLQGKRSYSKDTDKKQEEVVVKKLLSEEEIIIIEKPWCYYSSKQVEQGVHVITEAEFIFFDTGDLDILTTDKSESREVLSQKVVSRKWKIENDKFVFTNKEEVSEFDFEITPYKFIIYISGESDDDEPMILTECSKEF